MLAKKNTAQNPIWVSDGVAVSADTFANLNANFPPSVYDKQLGCTTSTPKQLFFALNNTWWAIGALE